MYQIWCSWNANNSNCGFHNQFVIIVSLASTVLFSLIKGNRHGLNKLAWKFKWLSINDICVNEC